jgi:hypothetical protein
MSGTGKIKIFGYSVGGLAIVLTVVFVLGLFGLGYYKFFAPKKENIRREVFEETQSYVHGKIQDLAKYREEYYRSTDDGKEALKATIIMRFAEFDETQIRSPELRQFLKETRGY